MKTKIHLIIAFIGNAIDAISTLVLYQWYGLYEVNPIMRYLLTYPVLFAIVKIGAMSAVLQYLWVNRTDRHAPLLATITAVIYGLISLYYVIFFTVLL